MSQLALLFTDIEGSTQLLRRIGDHYVTVLSELILSGESAFLNKTDEKLLSHDNGLNEKFDRLADLQKQLGKSTLHALTSLLPFSRNDYWELKELREDVKRGHHSSKAPLPDIN